MLSLAISRRVRSPETSLDTRTCVWLWTVVVSADDRTTNKGRAYLEEVERKSHVPEHRGIIGAQSNVDALIHQYG